MIQARRKLLRVLNWPNRISLARLALIAPFIWLLMNQQRFDWATHAALGVLFVMAVSDAVDGQLARRLGARTRLGAILDPLADKVLIICSVVLLSLEGTAVPGYQLPDYMVVVVVGKDLWVVIGFIVLYLVTDRFRVQPTIAGKLSTMGQLAMTLAVLLAPDIDNLSKAAAEWIVTILIWAVVIFSLAAVVSYTRLGLQFLAEGQKPLDDSQK